MTAVSARVLAAAEEKEMLGYDSVFAFLFADTQLCQRQLSMDKLSDTLFYIRNRRLW